MIERVFLAVILLGACAGSSKDGDGATPDTDGTDTDVDDTTDTDTPDTDTVEALHKYADRWRADPERWLFARADMGYTRRVAAGMQVPLNRKGHRDDAIVIDKSGKIRGYYDATSKGETKQLRAKLLECLEETAPENKAVASLTDASTNSQR